MTIHHDQLQGTGRRTAVWRVIAVLGIVGASIGASAGSASATPSPGGPLCGLLSACEPEPDPSDEDDDDTLGLDVDLDPDDGVGVPATVDVDVDLHSDGDSDGDSNDGLVDVVANADVDVDAHTNRDDVLNVALVAEADVDVDIDSNRGITGRSDIASDLTIGKIGVHVDEAVGTAIRRGDDGRGLVATVDSTASAGAAVGGHTIDAAAALCGVQVVVATTAERTCTSGLGLSDGGDGHVTDLDVATSLCGLGVAVFGSSDVRCSPGSDDRPDSDSFIDGDLTATICGVQIAVFGSAGTNCPGGSTGADLDGCLAVGRLCELIDLDGDLDLCGLGVALIGSTHTNCGDDLDEPTDPDGPGDDPSDDSDDPGGPDGPGDQGDDPADDAADPDDASDPSDADRNPDAGETIDDQDGDTVAMDVGPSGFTGGTSGELPFTGGSIALVLIVAAITMLTGFALKRNASRS